MDQPIACGVGSDCNDLNAAVHPGAVENGATCVDAVDNNCNGEIDYDGFTNGAVSPVVHGDAGCPVGVLSIAMPSTVVLNQKFYVNCTENVGSVRSIDVTGSAGVSCDTSNVLWTGTKLSVNCTTTVIAGSITCSVNTGKSYDIPPPQTVAFGPGTVTWLGNVTDIRTGQRVGVAANVRVDNGAFVPAPLGAVNVTGLTFGFHNITANAPGYDPLTVFKVPFNTDPTYADIPLSPLQCRSDCTYGGVCDFSCVQDPSSQCKMNASLSPAENGNITQICQYAVPGSFRQYNDTAYVQCCIGPIVDNSLYMTKFSLQSCASQGITHKIAVIVNGKQMQLTVLSYDKCS